MTRWFWPAVGLTALAWAAALYVGLAALDRLPERVPVHWDIHFEPDHFVLRQDMLGYLLAVPGAMTGVLLLTLVLPWLSPKHFEVDRFRDVYGYLMAVIVALLGYLHAVLLLTYLNVLPSPGRWFVGGIFLFLALMGNVLGRVRRNFWMGVRTPWTLASEAVWEGTHRQAAYVFFVLGLAGFVAVLLGVPLLWCFVGLIAAALWTVVYSLLLYKRLEKQGRL
jgi:uncharacterized membrane protein